MDNKSGGKKKEIWVWYSNRIGLSRFLRIVRVGFPPQKIEWAQSKSSRRRLPPLSFSSGEKIEWAQFLRIFQIVSAAVLLSSDGVLE